jgi:beta-glucosidase
LKEKMDLHQTASPSFKTNAAAHLRKATLADIGLLVPFVEYLTPRGGEALAGLLVGKVNFSGKLAITFPASNTQLPHATLPLPPNGKPSPADGVMNSQPPFPAPHDEGLKVGYKWYEAEGKKPAYPFGFGLSYTSFSYSKLKATGGEGIQASFVVRNTGSREGSEVAQLYLSFPSSASEPPKRLVGWKKLNYNQARARQSRSTSIPCTFRSSTSRRITGRLWQASMG